MSDPHDAEPDPAALDELLRAFGEERDEATEEQAEPAPIVVPLEADEAEPEPGRVDLPGEPDEILIVEQEPMPEPADDVPAPP